MPFTNDKPVCWWNKALGGFYLSYESIPEKDLKKYPIVPLYEKETNENSNCRV